MIAPYLIGAILVLSLISDWIRRHAVDLERYELGPDFRFIVWGRIDGWSYLLVKLPSWLWTRDLIRNRMCWHQRVLRWSAEPGDFQGWSVAYWPMYEGHNG